MQQQMMRHEESEEELNEVKSQLSAAEWQRNRALDELREIKRMSQSDVITSSSVTTNQELNSTKESLLNANRELKIKDKTIESLTSEIQKVKQLELNLIEKDSLLHSANEELNSLKDSVAQTESFLSDSKKRVMELEAEKERRKESESKLFDSFEAQKSQLEKDTIFLEKSKLEVASIRKKMYELEQENQQKIEIEKLQNEGGECEIGEMKNLVDEIWVLKNELKQAMEAEENSKRAMDDLALALKEVATESKQATEKLKSTEEQLEAVKEEADNLKRMVKSRDETYDRLLGESKKESDRLKNTVDRLRSEAEESLLAWNEKEIEFVKCIKKGEAEKNQVQEENKKLKEICNNSKEENRKLRDILKQALNESNVAKEAANLARDENSNLKDALTEKDKALVSLAQETERLRINEAEANESIKELKRVIASGSKKAKKETGSESNSEKEPIKERKLSSTFNFDLNQLWPVLPGITAKLTRKEADEYPENLDDALVGSIFDLVESPPLTVKEALQDDGKSTSLNLEIHFEEGEQFDDMEIDRTSQGKRKALLRRFGDLLKRKNSHPSPKESPKEVAHPHKEIPV